MENKHALGSKERPYPLGPGEMPIPGEHFDSVVFGKGYCDENGILHRYSRWQKIKDFFNDLRQIL